jgi:DNA-binding NarL/FixJ family response regulator
LSLRDRTSAGAHGCARPHDRAFRESCAGFAVSDDPLSSPRVRVGMVDAHDLLLAGARALMAMHSSPAEFVAGANTVEVLLKGGHQFDVVVLDVRLSDGSTAEENVRRLSAESWTVLLHADRRHREAGPVLRRSPASGLVWKNDGARALLDAIVTVGRGEEWTSEVDANTVDLTHRETQVLICYAAGRTYAETAQYLNPPISVESVKTYLSRIRKRYEAAGRPASTRLELRRRALEDGIVAPE